MATQLTVRQLEVNYGAGMPPVLRLPGLEMQAGIFLGIVGPNGSGKSTLVRALSRTLRPALGVVLLDGCDLYEATAARDAAQVIAVVPQDTGVSLGFTVREIVRMGRAPHLARRPFAGETAADEQIVSEAIAMACVTDLADRIVTTLSGGERQRVLLARALAQQPDVLLLDEPTASLDLRHQTETLLLAQSLAHDAGKAVLAVLHDVNLAAAYCDQLVLLHQGKIAAQGTPEEVLTAANLQRVYGTRVWVRSHPATGRPLVLSLPELPDDTRERILPRVHLICGGGTGTEVMLALHAQGFSLTAAGLNAGDTDADAAKMLGVPFAQETPFSPLSPAVLTEAARLAEGTESVLVTEVPFGRANLANLEAALALRLAGKRVGCLQSSGTEFAGRDFTGGAAALLWNRLLAAGAVLIPSTPDLAGVLNWLRPEETREVPWKL